MLGWKARTIYIVYITNTISVFDLLGIRVVQARLDKIYNLNVFISTHEMN